MAMTWDLTDVPTVEVADLAAVMRALIDDGRGLVLRRGISDEDLNAVHAEVQRSIVLLRESTSTAASEARSKQQPPSFLSQIGVQG